MKKTLLIDAHAIIHRAFHALPPLTSDTGVPTNAALGFFTMLHRAIADIKPSGIIVCFDTPTPTFRKELYKEYQAKRPKPPEDLRKQFSLVRELLDAAKITRMEMPGFEADDIIGTIAHRHHRNAHTVILTGDKDLLQLVNKTTTVITPKTGLSTTVEYDENLVQEKMGVRPQQIPDLKALAGDASDNYHAIKGLGPKTAVKLLDQFNTIEGIYEHITQITPDKLREKLISHEQDVLLMKTIATVRTDVELDIPEDIYIKSVFPAKLRQQFEHYGLRSLSKKYQFQASSTTNEDQPQLSLLE